MAYMRSNALRGHLESLTLSALRQGDAHGFEILRRLEKAGSGVLKLKEGSLYPALYRLEAAGMIKGQWEDSASPRRGPRRRIYRLTQKGLRRLHEARSEFQQFVAVIGGILGASA
jgi:PadR family transcriptional regulator PadR